VKRRGEGFDVYAYFNNDPDAVAVQNAATLLQLTVGEVASRGVDIDATVP
jgi:uncharacterized protein YecE (DUF72 family)